MFRKFGWQVLLIVLGALATVWILVYLATAYTTDFRPAPGGTYVEGVGSYPQTLNPLLSAYNDADSDVSSLVFRGLTRLDLQGAPQPDLAERWDLDPSGITYTFHLRKRAFWHDGTPVTTRDVAFTVGLLQDPDYPGPPDVGALWRSVTVEVVDDTTIRFGLPEPYAPFVDYTTIGILPAHLLQGISAAQLPTLDFNRKPIGCGPFMVEEVTADAGHITSVLLKRFNAYDGQRPYLDSVLLRFYPSPQAALAAAQAGEVEGVARVPTALLQEAWAMPDMAFYSAPMAEMEMLYFNTTRTELSLDQPRFRQGLLYALNREALVNDVLQGQALVAQTPLLPGTWAYTTTGVITYTYAPDRALARFKEAGWTRDFITEPLRNIYGDTLALTLLTLDSAQEIATAQAIAAQWSQMGISVTVQPLNALALNEALEQRAFDAALVRVALAGDPDPYPLWHETQAESGQNYAGFRHRRISEVIEYARQVYDQDKRREAYAEYQRLFMEQLPAIPLYVPVYTYAVKTRVYDVQIGPLMCSGDRFRNIADWYILRRKVITSEH